MSRLLLALALVCAVLLVACKSDDNGDGVTPSADASPGVTATATEPPVETPTPTPEPEAVCAPNPDPGEPDIVVVDAPAAEDEVTSPVTVSGSMNVFEAQFNITIYDAAGNIVADVAGHTGEAFILSPFSEDVEFGVDEPSEACLWVYDASPRDGSPIDVVQVPLTLLP
ncbi:MAG: Gmad2 immunoglobulin-like domain-containing protein [Dehalococcoidia bacterium]